MQEPEALLRERQRQRRPARCGRDSGREILRASAQQTLDPSRQGRHGRALEDRPQRHLHTEGALQPRDQARGEQRMAAQLEEVVPQPHSLHSQHLRPDAAQSGLTRCARPH